jgi:hypothetical protein
MSGRHNAKDSYVPTAPETGQADTEPAQSRPQQWTDPAADGPPPSGDGPAQYAGV